MSIRHCVLLFALSLVAIGLAAAPSTATFAGEDGRISYATYANGDLEIHSANPDGSDVQRLTEFPGNNQGAVISDWSPDGQTIAFDGDATDIDGRKNVQQVYVMNFDGSGVTQLTRGPGFHGVPGWSPDASSLAIDADWGESTEPGSSA